MLTNWLRRRRIPAQALPFQKAQPESVSADLNPTSAEFAADYLLGMEPLYASATLSCYACLRNESAPVRQKSVSYGGLFSQETSKAFPIFLMRGFMSAPRLCNIGEHPTYPFSFRDTCQVFNVAAACQLSRASNRFRLEFVGSQKQKSDQFLIRNCDKTRIMFKRWKRRGVMPAPSCDGEPNEIDHILKPNPMCASQQHRAVTHLAKFLCQSCHRNASFGHDVEMFRYCKRFHRTPVM